MSIQSQVSKLLENEPTLTLKDTQDKFPKLKPGSVKTAYYRHKKESELPETSETITMDRMEKLLIKLLKKKPDVSTLRLMVDFLKIKQQDQSELQEIDMSIFYKKAMMD